MGTLNELAWNGATTVAVTPPATTSPGGVTTPNNAPTSAITAKQNVLGAVDDVVEILKAISAAAVRANL